MSEPTGNKPGNPNWSKGMSSPNPTGRPKLANEWRLAMARCADKIHNGLFALIDQGDKQAILYAHQQLIGKPLQSVELTGTDGGPVKIDTTKLDNEQLRTLRDLISAGSSSTPEPE